MTPCQLCGHASCVIEDSEFCLRNQRDALKRARDEALAYAEAQRRARESSSNSKEFWLKAGREEAAELLAKAEQERDSYRALYNATDVDGSLKQARHDRDMAERKLSEAARERDDALGQLRAAQIALTAEKFDANRARSELDEAHAEVDGMASSRHPLAKRIRAALVLAREQGFIECRELAAKAARAMVPPSRRWEDDK